MESRQRHLRSYQIMPSIMEDTGPVEDAEALAAYVREIKYIKKFK